jgi:ATP-dependent Lhr-like helicase
LDVVLEFLAGMRTGRISVVTISRRTPSDLAVDAVGEARFSDRIAKSKLTTPLLAEVVKRKLLRKRVCLVCLHCGFMWERSIGELESRISCPNCGSTMLYVSVSRDNCTSVSSIVRKKLRRIKLSKGEIVRLKEAYDVASLVNTYGRYAVEALATRGVGVSTARKVLQKLIFGEEHFYKALVEAEALYVKYSSKLKR